MFEYEGGQYTYEDLLVEANKQDVEFSEFMREMKKLGMTFVKDASEGQELNLDMSSQQPFEQQEKTAETAFYDYKKNSQAYQRSILDWFKLITDDSELPEVKETDRQKGSYFAAQKHLAPYMGYNNVLSNFFAEGISNMYRSGGIGVVQGEGTQPSWDVMSHGKNVTLEDAKALHAVVAKGMTKEQTDNVKKYQGRYEQVNEEYGGIMAFMVAVAENPMYLRDVSISSMASMATSLFTSEEVAKRAVVGTTLGATAGTVLPVIGTGLGAMSGLMGSVSGSMDAGLSYQQFLMEQITEDGLDFTPENIQKTLQNEEIITYKDPNSIMGDITGTRAEILKKRAIRRGIAIGFTDMATGVLSGGIAKGSIGMGSKLTTRTQRAVMGTGAAVGGGLTSEVMGQTFGSQEYDAGEILTEGFAEKGIAMTGVTVLPQLIKKKGKYSIRGEEMTESRFVREVNNMDDVTLAQASIKIENDPILDSKLGKRIDNAVRDSQIDAKVYEKEDRKELVKKQRELEKAEADKKKDGTAYAVPGAEAKVERIKAEIAAIIDKYAGVDGRKKDVRDRKKIKELVAKARERIQVEDYKEALKDTEAFLGEASKQIDMNPYKAFNNTDSFAKGVVDYLMNLGEYSFDGKKFNIKGKSNEQIAEEVQRVVTSASKGAGAVNLGNTIYINREAAVNYRQLDVGSHEILHSVLRGALATMNAKARKTMIAEFKQEISNNLGSKVLDKIDKRLRKGYTVNGKLTIDLDTTDEWFTALSDVIQDKKNGITYDNSKSFFDNIKNKVANLFNTQTEYKNLSIKTGKDAFLFMKEYSKSVEKGKLSDRMVAFAKNKEVPPEKRETTAAFSKDSKDDVDNLGKMGWNDKTWKESGATFAIETIKDEKLLDGLIYAKYKVEDVPANFVNDVITELTPDIKKFNSSYTKKNGDKVEAKWGTEQENDSLFGYLQGLIKFRAGDVYKKLYKGDKAIKGAKNIGETTKEGEVKVQVAAEKSTEMEAFEEEDLSIEGQAKKAKADKQQYSKYRRKLGFETGSKIYNEVLENVKKSLMIVYGTTQNIKDVQLRAKAIAAKMKKEYTHLDSPLFKQIKNFLTYGVADVYVKRGTKDIYFTQLKAFREDIVKNISTADLVQIERNTPEADKIFVRFVKTLTKISEVQDAVNKEKLPPEALNKITKDKKTGKGSFSPSLYDKIMPTETELVSWADQPGINPVTGLKQGLKGTRKDGIVKRMVNGLVTDAIMEARQSEEVQNKIANMNIDPLSVAELGAAIGREVNIKFSKSNAIGDVIAAMDGSGDVSVYSQIKFSKAHRNAYEKQLTKRRPDLTEKQRKNAVQSVFDFVDGKEIPNHKKSKYEKLAMHYTANGYLILPEDGYKVIEAERVATIKKLDAFSYKNPNVLIEENVVKEKVKRTNPDNLDTFTNKTELTNGVTVYEVEDSKDGQLSVRKVIDTHFGKKANPWCLCARDRSDTRDGDVIDMVEYNGIEEIIMNHYLNEIYEFGSAEIVVENATEGKVKKLVDKLLADKKNDLKWEVTDQSNGNTAIFIDRKNVKTNLDNAFIQWESYNEKGNGFKIAFHNGKLIAFRDGNNMSWWDRNDKATDAPVVRGKKGKDGFKSVSLVYKNKSEVIHHEKQTGSKKNGTLIKKDNDGVIILQETRKNGRTDGVRIRVDNKNKKSNEYNNTITETYEEGNRLNFKEVRNYIDTDANVNTVFGKDEIRLNNITKYERSFTEVDGLMDTETIITKGTVNQKYFKEFNDPSLATGFDKTNLQYLTSSRERYYDIQGEKVTVKLKQADGFSTSVFDSKPVTVIIDGVVQETRVKFSKSAVKFSLTKLEVDRKLGPYLAKQLKDSTSLEQQAFWSGIQELVGKGVPVVDAYNSVAQKVKNQYGVEIVGIKQLDDNVKNYYLPKIREAAKEFSVEWYKDQLKEVKGDIKAELDIINDYIINVGRPIRSGMVYNITSNEKLMNDVYKEFGSKYKKYYELVPVDNGQKVMFRTKPKEELQNINLYQGVTAIKSNPKQYWNKIDEQSVKARNWLNKLLDSKQNNGIKKAIIQLTSYGQRSPIRKLSKAGVYVEGLPTSKTTLEHEITVNDIHSTVIDHIDGKIDRAKLNELLDKAYVHVLPNKINDILKAAGKTNNRNGQGYNSITNAMEFLKKLNQAKKLKGNTDLFKLSKSQDAQTINNAVKFSRSANNPTKGITVLDFDDTLATTKSMIRFTRPDGTKGKLNAGQYASTYESLSELGYKWDFSEFNKVVDGKKAPLFEKALKLQEKFGPEGMFILTARPMEAAGAIHAFLKANGLNIPLKNIKGLGNSTAESKALWIAEKVGEGYNDFYFADDAIQNVKAVKNMLDQLDVKSKVQQARIKFSKNMDTEFNKVLERTTGVNADEIISGARAAKRGAGKGKYKFFVPPSADDFKGLLYYFVGKGKQGEKDMAFFKKALTDPLNRAYTEFNAARQSIANDYRNLKKQMPAVKSKLLKKTTDSDFTYGDAVRVYLWNKAGFDIPGLNQKDIDNLVEMVTSDPQLMIFAYKLGKISKRPEGYTNPTEYWQVGDIRNDLDDATGRVGRKEFFTEFMENAEQIFGKMVNGKLTGDNINKIEAIFGSNFREALEDNLHATYTGSTRTVGSSNRMVNGFTNWINGSVGAVMFINMRSALLQQLSTVNFLNWSDNNIFKAGAAFANFPQYIKDFSMLFNSDKLKQRRAGLSMDINANELATYLGKSKSQPAAILNWLLRKGFLPTQISDSFAIANGGATFYRNRVNTYLKQGLKLKEAEAKAFNDFSEIAEETQQSARPDMVSQQQRSPIGKWFLNFLNTPMQYSRIMKKAMLDLVNRRGDTKTHISRIIYYGAVQNLIFYTLQTGLFAAMFGDEDDEEDQMFFDTKAQMTANSMLDGLLKGLGFGGAAISTVKNMIIKFIEEDRKGYKGKPAKKVVLEMVNFSPVVGIKIRKISHALDRYAWDKEVVKHMETFDIDNPIWDVSTGIIEGATNVPLNRLYRKTMNLRAATDADREAWQRLALVSGWSVWNIGEQNEAIERIKEEIKAEKKMEKKRKNKSNDGFKKKTFKKKVFKVKN